MGEDKLRITNEDIVKKFRDKVIKQINNRCYLIFANNHKTFGMTKTDIESFFYHIFEDYYRKEIEWKIKQRHLSTFDKSKAT